MGIMEKVPVKIFYMEFFFASSGYLKSPQGTYLIRLNLRDNRKEQQEWMNILPSLLMGNY